MYVSGGGSWSWAISRTRYTVPTPVLDQAAGLDVGGIEPALELTGTPRMFGSMRSTSSS